MSKIYNQQTKKFELPDLPYKYGSVKGISEDTDRFHHDKHFNSYITGLNEGDEKLAKMRASGDYAVVRGAMLGFSHNASGAYLHNIYYHILGGDGQIDKNLAVAQKIKEDFGSLEAWKKEFSEIAKVARGWAVLGLFMGDMRLRHNLVDFHDQQVAWGLVPLVTCDMWEHAYYYDNGPDKAKYLEAFLGGLDWKKIDDLYGQVGGR